MVSSNFVFGGLKMEGPPLFLPVVSGTVGGGSTGGGYPSVFLLEGHRPQVLLCPGLASGPISAGEVQVYVPAQESHIEDDRKGGSPGGGGKGGEEKRGKGDP